MSDPKDNHSNMLPLREPTFFILLSLAPGQKHGYAILKDVESLSHGRIKLSTGTLYEALARLLEQGLIERISGEPALDGDASHGKPGNPGRPRKAYRLTQNGRAVLEGETNRMQALVTAARLRLRADNV